MKRILVTGGAGYVGAHVCQKLADSGFVPITYDNLSSGHREAVQFGPLVFGDIRDTGKLVETFLEFRPDAVMHFAARSEVGRSMTRPAETFSANLGGTASLLHACELSAVKHFVFSSTCAIFGEANGVALDERAPQSPASIYGQSKRMVEDMISASSEAMGLRSVSLRYFNAAGADPAARIGENHHPETHLIPLAIQAALDPLRKFKLHGTDYATPDGTAVRDYVHVLDLADAHVKSLEYLRDGGGSTAFNLGSGRGYSVREVIATVEMHTGRKLNLFEAARRPGDPAHLLANPAKAASILGWQARLGLTDMVADATRWHQILAERKRDVA